MEVGRGDDDLGDVGGLTITVSGRCGDDGRCGDESSSCVGVTSVDEYPVARWASAVLGEPCGTARRDRDSRRAAAHRAGDDPTWPF